MHDRRLNAGGRHQAQMAGCSAILPSANHRRCPSRTKIATRGRLAVAGLLEARLGLHEPTHMSDIQGLITASDGAHRDERRQTRHRDLNVAAALWPSSREDERSVHMHVPNTVTVMQTGEVNFVDLENLREKVPASAMC